MWPLLPAFLPRIARTSVLLLVASAGVAAAHPDPADAGWMAKATRVTIREQLSGLAGGWTVSYRLERVGPRFVGPGTALQIESARRDSPRTAARIIEVPTVDMEAFLGALAAAHRARGPRGPLPGGTVILQRTDHFPAIEVDVETEDRWLRFHRAGHRVPALPWKVRSGGPSIEIDASPDVAYQRLLPRLRRDELLRLAR